ncbi:DUF3656 domain-containing protein [Methanobrevibacter sp. DSM 116169]|uniref:U32 family peptidase n=1 Tax=Methanobrevibacter sp. DSM 116169 TaxID=3242727 RepID=UPI0038FCD096
MVLSELLAPAGAYDVFKVAINAGADAVYIAGQRFGARAFAQNFSIEEIEKSINYAHLNNAKVYVTINTLVNNFEIAEVLKYIFKLYKFGVDAVIIQDFGILQLIKSLFPDLKVHASTQMTLNNYECVLWAYKNGISRVIFPRELSVEEISAINSKLKENGIDIELEVFGHGALCYSISGNCYISSLNSGRSGNRGACAQPCRREYKLKYKGYNIGNGHLLSTHDLNTSDYLDELSNAGISSLKLEGRMKSEDYIGTIVNSYRNILDFDDEESKKNLNLVFNRKFTKGYLLGDKPGDVMGRQSSGHEGLYIGDIIDVKGQEITIAKDKDITLKTGDGIAFKYKNKIKGIYVDNITYQNKDKVKLTTTRNVRSGDRVFISYSSKMHKKLRQFRKDNIQSKVPISLNISFDEDLHMVIYYNFKLRDITLNSKYVSKSTLDKAINKPILKEDIEKQISKTGGTPFYINEIKVEGLPDNSFMSMGDLNKIRRELLERASEILLNYYKPNKKQINELNNNLNDFIKKYNNKDSKINRKRLGFSVFVDSLENLKAASTFPLKKIYFDPSYGYNNPEDYFDNIKQLLIDASCNTFDSELVWVLPSFISSEEISKCSEILNELLNEGIPVSIMCDSPGLKDSFNSQIYGNHNLNIWNSFACENLYESGFNSLILSSELSYEEIKEINSKSDENDLELELIVHGNLEVITSFDDFSALNEGKDFIISNNSDYATLEDKKRKKFRYKVLFDFNKKSHILNKDCLCLIDEMDKIKSSGIDSIIVDCRFSNDKYTSKIISFYMQALRNNDKTYLTSLRQEVNSFSQSYINKGNFLEGRLHEEDK